MPCREPNCHADFLGTGIKRLGVFAHPVHSPENTVVDIEAGGGMENKSLEKVYTETSVEGQRAAYDAWANAYEQDLCAMGYRIPGMLAATFARFVPVDCAPILDAGCGGGLQTEALVASGFGPFTGIDLSQKMLEVARSKGVYADLKQQTLGEPLDFETDFFGAAISTGTFTPGHAPPSGFDEIQRVIRPGGYFVIVLRCDAGMTPDYQERLDQIEKNGGWRHVFSGSPGMVMPYAEPDVLCRSLVYKVLS